MERKCSSCNTWNGDNDFCSNCNTPISHNAVRTKEINDTEERNKNKPKDTLDILYDKAKNSKNPIVKGMFYLFYSIWSVFVAIVSFFLFMIASTPG